MRQGTLQILATLNLTPAQLRSFSAHTSDKMLRHYLKGGKVLEGEQKEAQRNAAGLAGAGEVLFTDSIFETILEIESRKEQSIIAAL